MIARESIRAGHGIFDPRLEGAVEVWHSAAHEDSGGTHWQQGGSQTWSRARSDSSAAGGTVAMAITGLLPWGTRYSVSIEWDSSSDDSDTRARTAGLNSASEPVYGPGWTTRDVESSGCTAVLRLTQPLLQGRGKTVVCSAIHRSENDRVAALALVRLTVDAEIARAVRAYWAYVSARETVRVRLGDVAQAERLLDDNKVRQGIGVAAASEVKQARAGLASRQTALARARLQKTSTEDALKEVMGWTPHEEDGQALLVPVDAKRLGAMSALEPPAYAESRAHALKARPELVLQDAAQANLQIDLAVAHQDCLARLDLFINAEHRTGRTKTWDRSFMDGFGRDFGREETRGLALSAGIDGSFPLGNREARHAKRRAQFKVEQGEHERRALEQAISWQVKGGLEDWESSREIVRHAEEAVELARTNLNAERERLKLGVSTSFQVLRVQQDLTEAELEAVHARVSLAIAIMETRLAEGRLLKSLELGWQQEGNGNA